MGRNKKLAGTNKMTYKTDRALARTLKTVRCRTEAVKTLRSLLSEQPRALSVLFKNLKTEELQRYGSGVKATVLVDRKDNILVWRVRKYPEVLPNTMFNPYCPKGHIDIFNTN